MTAQPILFGWILVMAIWIFAWAWNSLRSRGPLCSWFKAVWHKLMLPSTTFFASLLGGFAIIELLPPSWFSEWISNWPLYAPFASRMKNQSFISSSFAPHHPKLGLGRWPQQAACRPSSSYPSALWSVLTSLYCNIKGSRIMGVLIFIMIHAIWKFRNCFLHCAGYPSPSSPCHFFKEEASYILSKLSYTVHSSSLRSLTLYLGVSPSL